MQLEQVMSELESYGSAQTRKIIRNHGGPDNAFGVMVGRGRNANTHVAE